MLDLANASFTLPSPRQAALYTDLNPRDRWVRQTIDSVAWYFAKRFTLRASVAAHLALDVDLQVVGPEEVLRLGGVEWRAELVETAQVAQEMGAKTGVPNHAVVASVVPRETGLPSKGGERVVFEQPERREVPAEILANDTIRMSDDPADVPRFPCPKLYLHLVVRETGVPIPPADVTREVSAFKRLFWLAETVFGSLASEAETREKAESVRTAPIHLTLERLYLGAVPATALSMALPMAMMLVVGWWGVRPLLDEMLPKMDKAGKDE